MDERFRIKTPCAERPENIARVAGALYCSHCEKTVVDLTRATRREALARAPKGSCVRLRVDRDGNPVFRPDVDRFVSPRTLALVASLAGCAADPAPPTTASIDAPQTECLIPLEPDAPVVEEPIASVEPDALMVEEATRLKRNALRPHPTAQPIQPAAMPTTYEIIDGGI